MGALISALAQWLAGIFGKFLAFGSTHFLATKIILTTLFITILPIVINNLIYDITEEIFNLVSFNLDTSNTLSQTVFEFTDLAGWLIQIFKIDQAFSVVISAAALKFTLRLIPFVRV